MKIDRKRAKTLEITLLVLSVIQILFFFMPLYDLKFGVGIVPVASISIGIYTLAFGTTYYTEVINGNLLWLVLLLLPFVSIAAIIGIRRNRLLKYGISIVVSSAECIFIKLIGTKLYETASHLVLSFNSNDYMQKIQLLLGKELSDWLLSHVSNNVQSTNLYYMYFFILIITILSAALLIVINKNSLQDDVSDMLRSVNAQASKIHTKINAFTDVKICQNCGAEISGDAEFCSKCGSRYVAREDSRVIKCPNCGELIREGAKFCKKCGEPLEK